MFNKDIPFLKLVLEKLYNEPDISANAKLDIVAVVRKVRNEEKLFMAQRDRLIDKYCEKDKKGNRVIAVQKINGQDMPVFVFNEENQKLFDRDILPLMNRQVLMGIKINMGSEDVAKTKLTPKDIEFLDVTGVINLQKKNVGGIILGGD